MRAETATRAELQAQPRKRRKREVAAAAPAPAAAAPAPAAAAPAPAAAAQTEALEHDDECFHCGQAALADMTLLNCDLCTRSYHFACADLTEEPTGVFACPACAPEGLCHVTGEAPAPHRCGPVSYTHLTLPTIYSV